MLIKNALNNKDDVVARSEYTKFENENENEFINHSNNQENYDKNNETSV